MVFAHYYIKIFQNQKSHIVRQFFGQGKHEQKLTLNCDLIAESGVLKGADKI